MVDLDPPLASARGGREMKRLNWRVRKARDLRQQRVADAVGMFTITIIIIIITAIGPRPKFLRWAGRIVLCHP